MKIRNSEELRLFERAIDACHTAVWLVTPDGMRYNLKEPMERYQGMGKLIHGHCMAEPEIYASSYEDERTLFGFIIDCMGKDAKAS